MRLRAVNQGYNFADTDHSQIQYGQHTVTIETGMMARQATAAVMVSMDDTAVFVTVVGQKKPSRARASSR